MLVINVESNRVGSQEVPADKIRESAAELTNSSEGHRLIVAPVVERLGLNILVLLGPHESDCRAMGICRDGGGENRDPKPPAKVGKSGEMSLILPMGLQGPSMNHVK